MAPQGRAAGARPCAASSRHCSSLTEGERLGWHRLHCVHSFPQARLRLMGTRAAPRAWLLATPSHESFCGHVLSLPLALGGYPGVAQLIQQVVLAELYTVFQSGSLCLPASSVSYGSSSALSIVHLLMGGHSRGCEVEFTSLWVSFKPPVASGVQHLSCSS